MPSAAVAPPFITADDLAELGYASPWDAIEGTRQLADEDWAALPGRERFRSDARPRRERLDNAARLLAAGATLRAVQRDTGMSRVTLRKLKRALELEGRLLCRCGQPSGHQGWCRVRFAASPARQAWMRAARR